MSRSNNNLIVVLEIRALVHQNSWNFWSPCRHSSVTGGIVFQFHLEFFPIKTAKKVVKLAQTKHENHYNIIFTEVVRNMCYRY